MPRPIRATIDLAALRHNLAAARARAVGRSIWAVVKANAYGHGLERAARAFDSAEGLALLDLKEAERARAAGWSKPILLLEGLFEARDLDAVRALNLSVVVHCEQQIDWLAAASGNTRVRAHVKMNTGMNRLGFAGRAFEQACRRLAAMPAVRVEGLMVHFANADRAQTTVGPVPMREQWERFDSACAARAEPRSASNSAALFLHPAVGDQWVRPGIALYGAMADNTHSAAVLGLRPAMLLNSELIAVQEIAAGEAVGYGARFLAPRPMRIGVVACGYADGYPRHAPDGTPVSVAGVRVALVGRVSMDMLTVDLSAVPQAGLGSPVELWGKEIPIDEVARHAGTVGYELMCALAARVPVIELA